jgi:hypothetical protein
MWRRATGAALGVVAGVAAVELFLMPLASAHLAPAPNIAADSLRGSVTYHQLFEGVSTSTFSTGGARRTGRDPIPGARNVVLLGDSYVAGREVPDEATMGAEIERLASAAHRAVNVRSYGWPGAVPHQYVHVAPVVQRRWNPDRVVVVLSDEDLDRPADTVIVATPPLHYAWRDRFRLTVLARHRNRLLGIRADNAILRWKHRLGLSAAPTEAAPATSEEESAPAPAGRIDTPQLFVGDLKRAYGARLLIVHIATVGMHGGESSTAPESSLREACETNQVSCAFTRARMVALRQQGVIMRGFSTTTIGNGHLNASGNALMGQIIWDFIR